MAAMKLTNYVYKKTLKQGEPFSVETPHAAIWLRKGSVTCEGQAWKSGDGFYLPSDRVVEAQHSSELLCFCMTAHAGNEANERAILTADFDWDLKDCILRLDTVTFPKGAVAYRHVHAGAGMRYLARGALEVQSDQHTEHMAPGDAWFEAANSPVRATGSKAEISQFIRALILPAEYIGKPTITLLNSEDFDKPKLQTNHRFFDQRISI
jgi:hypothetical protein